MRQAHALAEKLNDDRRCGLVCAHLMDALMLRGELDEARTCGTKALAIARTLGDLDLRILTTGYLEEVHYHFAEYERTVELAKGNLAALPANRIYDKFGRNFPASVCSLHNLVISLSQLGRFSEAAEYLAGVNRIAEATRHAYTLGTAHRGAVMLHVSHGDWPRAHLESTRMIAVLRSGHVVDLLPAALAHSAMILARLGETSAVLSRLREYEQLVERLTTSTRSIGMPDAVYLALGRTCLLLGRLDEAWKLGNDVVESFVSQPGFMATALHLLGDVASHPDRFDAESAETKYREALALAEPRGMRPLVAHCLLGLGKLYTRAGKREEAQKHLPTATTMYREMGMTYWLEQAEAEIRVLA
jgi:tetratricopeptide (TPR) repeat protein